MQQEVTTDDQFHNIPLQTVESHWRTVFSHFDLDGSGRVPLSYFVRELARNNYHVPPHVIHRITVMADLNQDGYITFPEFLRFIETPEAQSLVHKTISRYVSTFVPKPQRKFRDLVDGTYEAEYNCSPPALTMIAISIVEIFVYLYDVFQAHETISPKARGFVLLVYNPHRRAEIWRFFTYMFIHSNEMHLFVNLFVQIMLGIPLEMVHRWWRILVIYIAGVISGSLCTSVADPTVFLAGASGGVYAIMTAHIATIILNWSEMDYPAIQLCVFLLIGGMDIANAVYYRYIAEIDTRIGYAAHLAGAIAGFLVGVYVLRNLKVKPWERILWWVCFISFAVLIVITVSWNVFFPSYFAEQYKFGQYLF